MTHPNRPYDRLLPHGTVRLLNQMWYNEAGGVTAYALFVFSICMMLGGLAIDISNAWRTRTELSVISDIGAHAGIVELARSGSPSAAHGAALLSVAGNRSSRRKDQNPDQARASITPTERIFALRYDPEQNLILPSLPDDPAANAIAVQLRYDTAERTSLPSIFLQMVGWNIGSHSIAALVPSRRCIGGNGLFSRGEILLDRYTEFGQDVCMHAQRRMTFWTPPKLAQGAQVSLPNLNGCEERCTDLLTSAIGREAMTEVNLLQPGFAAHMEALAQSFTIPALDSPAKRAFFAHRPLARDLSALSELGVAVSKLKQGAVVDLQPIQLQRARHLPRGLVYSVSCVGEREDTFLILGAPGPTLHGSALVTDCPVVVSRARDLSDALVTSTWDGIPGTTLPGIEIMARGSGGPCRKKRSVLMARQQILLLSGASASGLGIVSAAEVTLQPPPAQGPETTHRGLSVHAGHTIHVEGEHRFEACPEIEDDGLLPPRQIIRYVEPANLHSIFPPATKLPAEMGRRVSPKEQPHNKTQGDARAALP